MDERIYQELLKEVYKDITKNATVGTSIKAFNTAAQTEDGSFIAFEGKFKITFGLNPTFEYNDCFIKTINLIEYDLYKYEAGDDGFAEEVEDFDINSFMNDLQELSI